MWGERFERRLGRGWGIVEEGGTDDTAPSVAAEGFRVFVSGELDGLKHDLAEISERGGSFRFEVALSGGGEEPAEGDGEFAGGDVFAGEAFGDVAAEVFGGASLCFAASVEEAEVRMARAARSAAAAAIGESESAERGARLL